MNVSLLTEAKDKAPKVEVTPGGIRMSGKASIAILNPLNNEIRAATINIKLNVTLQLSVEKGFILKAKASGIDIDVVAKKVLWDSPERLDTIRSKFKLI